VRPAVGPARRRTTGQDLTARMGPRRPCLRRCVRWQFAHKSALQHKRGEWVGSGRKRKSSRPSENGAVDLSPFEFLDRLAYLVPPPQKHRHRIRKSSPRAAASFSSPWAAHRLGRTRPDSRRPGHHPGLTRRAPRDRHSQSVNEGQSAG